MTTLEILSAYLIGVLAGVGIALFAFLIVTALTDKEGDH